MDQAAELPALMPPVRDSDAGRNLLPRDAGAVPGLPARADREPGRLRAQAGGDLPRPGAHAEGYFYLQGEWRADDEYVMKPWAAASSMSIRYTAKGKSIS